MTKGGNVNDCQNTEKGSDASADNPWTFHGHSEDKDDLALS